MSYYLVLLKDEKFSYCDLFSHPLIGPDYVDKYGNVLSIESSMTIESHSEAVKRLLQIRKVLARENHSVGNYIPRSKRSF